MSFHMSSELVTEACYKLLTGSVIAIPTDTVYGLAGLVQSNRAIASMYAIKQRDPNKPFAICLSKVEDIAIWAKVDILPPELLHSLLPGKVTVVLERKLKLNPALNPGNPKVGIRVPGSEFIRNVVAQLKQPIALTSANTSNERSCIRSEEFSHIWPLLAAIYYDDSVIVGEELRAGSTVVDLSVEGKYYILRPGVCLASVKENLKMFNLVDGSL